MENQIPPKLNFPEVRNWDEHCQKCIRFNGCEPEEMCYCPAEDDCEYWIKTHKPN